MENGSNQGPLGKPVGKKFKGFWSGKRIFYAVSILLVLMISALILSNLYPGVLSNQESTMDSAVSPGYDVAGRAGEELVAGAPEADSVKDKSGNTGNGVGTTGSDTAFDTTKIIYSGNISISTDDYRNTLAKIQEYTQTIGGFVQDASSTYVDQNQNTVINSGYITIRIPSEKFESAMKEIQTYGSPISSSIYTTNITQQYQDIKGQLTNLQIQEERLLEYLRKAEKIQDMLTIESELNRVRTEIDYRTTLIKNWDTEIAYSTISISVYEKELSTSAVESPFADMVKRVQEGFIASVNLILNVLAELIVWIFRLIPVATILGVAYFVFRKIKKASNKTK